MLKLKREVLRSSRGGKNIPINKEVLDQHQISHWHYWILEANKTASQDF